MTLVEEPVQSPYVGRVIQRIFAGIEAYRHMPGRTLRDQLKEVAVSNDEVVQSAAVDVASLAGQLQQRQIDEQLFVPVRFRR